MTPNIDDTSVAGEGKSLNAPPDGRMLTAEQVRRVAKLARLSLDEDRVQQLRGELAGVLAYMDRLGEVDVSGVEPMTHPTEASNRLDQDEPAGDVLTTESLMAIAPETMPPFVKVPKVMGEGSA